MRRTRISRESDRRKAKRAQVGPFRVALIEATGECMLCGTNPKRPKHSLAQLNELCCHEILNGPLRDKCLAERSCLIVACWHCNGGPLNQKGEWPLARQLAVIKHKALDRYDLKRVLEIRNPGAMNFVTEDEVDEWIERDWH